MPTSAEINRAIETLRAAGLRPASIRDLDRWNANRIKAAAQNVTSREEAAGLFEGISPAVLAEAGIT